jgi:ATP-dependent protease ClpP protease subunit
MNFINAIALPIIMSIGCACATDTRASRIVAERLSDKDFGTVKYIPLLVGIDGNSAAKVVRQINEADKAGASMIVIEINSPGGSVTDGLDIIKAIERANAPVVCVVDGGAYSMGFVILESCDVRLMTNRSSLMMHQASVGGYAPNRESEFKDMADFLNTINEGMIAYLSTRMTVSADFIREKMTREWWMGTAEAKSVGAIDCSVASVIETLNRAQHGEPMCALPN